jgi:hypothetical protein
VVDVGFDVFDKPTSPIFGEEEEFDVVPSNVLNN